MWVGHFAAPATGCPLRAARVPTVLATGSALRLPQGFALRGWSQTLVAVGVCLALGSTFIKHRPPKPSVPGFSSSRCGAWGSEWAPLPQVNAPARGRSGEKP
jgi:hypothetical protein